MRIAPTYQEDGFECFDEHAHNIFTAHVRLTKITTCVQHLNTEHARSVILFTFEVETRTEGVSAYYRNNIVIERIFRELRR